MRHATVVCSRRNVEIIQLSCDNVQQSHVAQISPFTQRKFGWKRYCMFLLLKRCCMFLLLKRYCMFLLLKRYCMFRNKDKLRAPHVIRNWGKQRMAYHAIIDWNTLNKDIRSSLNIVIFKHKLLKFLQRS